MMSMDPGPLVRPLAVLVWRRLWQFCSDWNWITWWLFSVGSVRTKRSRVQRCFRLTFETIVVLCLRPDHSIRCNFTNIMDTGEPVWSMHCRASSVRGGKDVPKFIRCVEGRQPKINEVCTFGENGVTLKVHPTSRVDVSAGFVGNFATNFLTPTWRRIPMFGRSYIDGSVKWLRVPNFLRNDITPWNLNLLAPYACWGYIGSSTSPNLGSGSGGYFDSISINWNFTARVLPVYHRRIFESTHSAACCARDDILMENHMYRMQSPSACCNPIRGFLVNRQDDDWYDCWDFSVCQ